MPSNNKYIKKLIIAGTIVASLATIGGAINYGINKYSNLKEKSELEFRNKVKEIIKEEDDKILNKVEYLEEELHNLDNTLREGSEYFSVGYRGDGSGELWWRDIYGDLYKVYHIEYSNQYYYVKDGLSVYLN